MAPVAGFSTAIVALVAGVGAASVVAIGPRVYCDSALGEESAGAVVAR